MKIISNPFLRISCMALFGATIIPACLTLPVMAADITWDASPSPANNNWSTFANWSDDATPTDDDITFNNTGTAAGTTVTNTVDTSYTIDSLQFTQSSAANHTTSISNGQTLTVNGSFTPTNGQATAVMFSKPDGNNTATTNFTGLGTFTVNNASNHFLVGFQNATSGSRVTVDMSGLENFNATVNIFGVGRKGTINTDTTRQESGILTLAKNSNVTATAITVGDSTGINGTANGAINQGTTSTLLLSAGGDRVNNLNADSMIFGRGKASGNMQFASGALATDTVKLRGTAGGTTAVTDFIIGDRNMASSSGTPSGTVDFGAGKVDALITNLIVARWGSSAGTSAVSPSATFSTGTNANSDITITSANLALNSGTGIPSSAQTMRGTLNVQGGIFSATTVNLATGANVSNLTRTATLNVDGGTFRFGSFGTPVGGYAINFNSGTVSSINGTGRTLSLAYNLGKAGGGTTVAFGQASGGTGTIELNGPGTLLGNTTVETMQQTTLGGAIGGAFSLTKTGAATLIVNQNQNYSGGTIINGGTIKMSGNRTLASGSDMEVGASGTWLLDGTSQTLGKLTGTGLVSSTWVTSGFDTLTVGSGNATSTFDGTIAGGNGTSVRGINLTKLGSGTLTLTSNSHSYTGDTNVNEGTLVVNGNISTSNVTVASGATIGGSGTVGALTIQSGGFVNPGNSPGILNTGNYNQVGTLVAEITGLTAGTQHDQINVIGTVTLSGALDIQASGGTYALNNMIFLILNDGADAVSGTFSGLAQGATAANFGGFDWIISYEANSTSSSFLGGNDVALRAIPEPSAALLGGLSALALLRRRRR
jgi:autotransporter-associated beta strand protein